MKYIGGLMLMIVSTTLAAQTRFDGLEQCLDFARQHNLALQTEKLNHSISEQKVKSAWAALLPQIKAFGTLDNNISLPVQLVPAQLLGGNEGEYAKLKFGTQYAASYGAEASLSLLNVAQWKNIKSAQYGEQANVYQAIDRELNVIEQVIASYYFALLSREAVSLNRELVEASDSLLHSAQARLDNGLIERLDYNRVKALNLESIQQLEESKVAFEKNVNALKLLCGLQSGDSLQITETISDSFSKNKTPSALTVTTESLPRYQVLSSRKLQAEEEWKRQRARIMPEISLYARYARQAFRDEFNFFSGDQPWFDVGVAGVRAEWSLFTGFNRQSSIKQASIQTKIAQQEFENYVLQAEKELDDLKLNHRVSAQGVVHWMDHYNLNSVNYHLAGEKYTQGVYTIDQYITIYQELVRSQNQYLNKLASYLVYESMIITRNALK
ncbi:MAG: TolC family protein [Bacteroidota bacterium]